MKPNCTRPLCLRPLVLEVALATGILAVLVGCAVPQAALDQANNAANLRMALEAQKAQFLKDQALVGAGRVKSIEAQQKLILIYGNYSQEDAKIAAAAGDSASAGLIATLTDLSDDKAKGRLALQASLSALDDEMSKLVSPVSSTAASAAAAEKKIAALGVQRNDKETFAFLMGYAKELKDGKVPAATPAASAASAAGPHQDAPSNKPPTALKE